MVLDEVLTNVLVQDLQVGDVVTPLVSRWVDAIAVHVQQETVVGNSLPSSRWLLRVVSTSPNFAM